MNKTMIKNAAVGAALLGFIAPIINEFSGGVTGLPGHTVQLYGFSLGLAFFVTSMWIEFSSVVGEIRSAQASIELSVKNRRDFVNEGPAEIAIRHLPDRFARATFISNVYVPFSNRPDILYTLDDPQRIKNINTFIAQPDSQKYTEIVSRDAFLESGSYRELIVDPKRKHVLKVTDRVFPVLNFIIFNYGSSQKEVLFGWGGYANHSTAQVYSTTEPDVVAMFEDIFRTLEDVSGSLGEWKSVIGRLERYLGIWVDIAVVQDASGSKIINAGVVSFDMEQVGKPNSGDTRLSVKGFAYEVDTSAIKTVSLTRVIRTFQSTSCEMRERIVYVSHESNDPALARSAAGSYGQSRYNFTRLDNTRRMYGEIFSPEVITNANANSISTVSVKLPPSEAAQLRELWDREGPVAPGICPLILPYVQTLVDEAFP